MSCDLDITTVAHCISFVICIFYGTVRWSSLVCPFVKHHGIVDGLVGGAWILGSSLFASVYISRFSVIGVMVVQLMIMTCLFISEDVYSLITDT